MGTFSALAKRYGLYMIGSADVPPFEQSVAMPRIVAAFADPDLHPRPASVYVATAPHVYNEVFMWGPHDVRGGGPDVLRNVVASNRKVPLTSLEVALGLTPGPARGPAAVANLRPYRAARDAGSDRLRDEPAGVHLGLAGAAASNPCSDTVAVLHALPEPPRREPRDPGRGQPGPLDRARRQRDRAVAAALVDGLDLPHGVGPVRRASTTTSPR